MAYGLGVSLATLAVLHGFESLLFNLLQNDSRAVYPVGPSIKDECVDHDGTYVLVA